MADHGAHEVDTATGVDYEEHLETYNAFLKATRWGVVGIVIILLIMAWFTKY